MQIVIILFVLMYVFASAGKANAKKNAQSKQGAPTEKPVDPAVVAQIERERRRAEFQAKYGIIDPPSFVSASEARQTAFSLDDEEEGSARPGSMDPFDGTRQGVSMEGARAINKRERPKLRNATTVSGSMGRTAGTQEGDCAPEHAHDSALKPGMTETYRATAAAMGKGMAKSAAAAKLPRFSENEAVNGMIWGEIMKKPRGARGGAAR